MDSFSKVVMPGHLPYGPGGRYVPAHFKINFIDGRFSISGVIGAKSNGDAYGSAGQCIESLLDPSLRLADGWKAEDITKFVDVWKRWHLNDMRAECEHQRTEGWLDKARIKATIYHWTLTREARDRKRAAERDAVSALKAGKTFAPTPEQVFFATLEYSIETHTESIEGELAAHYEPMKILYAGGQGHTEVKTLGWLRPNEHPDGLLCRPCPICGYKYGTSWLKEEVPEDVLLWIHSLPRSSVPCAWHNL